MEEFKVLYNIEKQQKTAKDNNPATRFIAIAGNVIKTRYQKDTDGLGKDGQKDNIDMTIERDYHKVFRDMSRVEQI